MAEEKLNAIAERISTEGGTLLYNPTCFERKAVVTKNGYCELSETVPPFGWTVVKSAESDCRVEIDSLKAENDFYILTLNADGEIESLWDKRAERQVLKGKGAWLTWREHSTCATPGTQKKNQEHNTNFMMP